MILAAPLIDARAIVGFALAKGRPR